MLALIGEADLLVLLLFNLSCCSIDRTRRALSFASFQPTLMAMDIGNGSTLSFASFQHRHIAIWQKGETLSFASFQLVNMENGKILDS